jgi:hypothetical protein
MYRHNMYYSYFTILRFEIMVYVTIALSFLDTWNLVKLFVIETKLSLQFVLFTNTMWTWFNLLLTNNNQFGNKFALLVIIIMNMNTRKVILSLKLWIKYKLQSSHLGFKGIDKLYYITRNTHIIWWC